MTTQNDELKQVTTGDDESEGVTITDIGGFAKVLDVLLYTDLIPELDRLRLGECIDKVSELAHASDTTKPRFLKLWLPEFLGITKTTEPEAGRSWSKKFTGTFLSQYGDEELTGAMSWLNAVVGRHSADAMSGLIEYLIDEANGEGDTLEYIRRALFIESDTFDEAYKLYCLRFGLKNHADPAELIANLIKDYSDREVIADGE